MIAVEKRIAAAGLVRSGLSVSLSRPFPVVVASAENVKPAQHISYVVDELIVDWRSVHGVLFYYGVALLDNALLEPLARACAVEERYEFMLTVSPLVVIGDTGSPVNPIALF